MEVRINKTMPREYAMLAIKYGKNKHTAVATTGALRDSLMCVGIYDDKQLVAFARVIGDGFLYYIVCDIMVDPEYEGFNLEYKIMKEINDYFMTVRTRESVVLVLADRPLDELCMKFGYKYMDPDVQVVMKK